MLVRGVSYLILYCSIMLVSGVSYLIPVLWYNVRERGFIFDSCIVV